jgi:ferredoxin-type protein NapG
MSDEKPLNRRAFFRFGLRELLKPIESAVEPIEEAVRQFSALEPAQNIKPRRKVALEVWLRPPGALPEQAFTDTCSRCGTCVSVCPAQCIKIDPSGKLGGGFPYIDANAMSCVVCDSLACMNHCPSGALVPTPVGEIDMGTAVWRESTCVRTRGESCTICDDHCPVGSVAIEVGADGRIHVIEDGCVGCGVCQHDCPTSPKSIVVMPKMARA